MILDLTKSKLFTLDPDLRFAKEYEVPPGTWRKLFQRYKLLDYTNGDLRDYLFIKHIRRLSPSSIQRWIIRSEVYTISHTKQALGARMVTSEVFGVHEQFVLDELTKNLRFSETEGTKAII